MEEALWWNHDGEPLELAKGVYSLRVKHTAKRGKGAYVRDPEDPTRPLLLDPSEPPPELPPGKYTLVQVDEKGRAIPGAEAGSLEFLEADASTSPPPRATHDEAHLQSIGALVSTVNRLLDTVDRKDELIAKMVSRKMDPPEAPQVHVNFPEGQEAGDGGAPAPAGADAVLELLASTLGVPVAQLKTDFAKAQKEAPKP